MPKTKRVVSKKPQAKASEPVKVAARKNACDSSCWLCWLFKLMIAMFVLMIIFWLGFCFGALSSEYPSKRAYKPMMSTLSPQNFCANPELKKDISVENAMSAMMDSLKNMWVNVALEFYKAELYSKKKQTIEEWKQKDIRRGVEASVLRKEIQEGKLDFPVFY
jgi:hypothetical protein